MKEVIPYFLCRPMITNKGISIWPEWYMSEWIKCVWKKNAGMCNEIWITFNASFLNDKRISSNLKLSFIFMKNSLYRHSLWIERFTFGAWKGNAYN